MNKKTLEERFADVGVQIPKIQFPKKGADLTKWAVIACDQFTSQHDYWEDVETLTKEVPSTYHLIFPECYLEEPNPENRIDQINANMRQYLNDRFLTELEPGFMLVERKTQQSPTRYGLVMALDLERYDYSVGSTSLIRATEGTIVDRLPPRVKIRKNAALEFPHIMVLINDPERKVIEPLKAEMANLPKAYDIELMKDGGHIRGFQINKPELLEQIVTALETIADPESFKNEFDEDHVLLYAMGDGNHSLATAKSVWENYKKENADDPDLMNHPARWALIELNNIFDEGLLFEPIHRTLFDVDFNAFTQDIQQNTAFQFSGKADLNAVLEDLKTSTAATQKIGVVHPDGYGILVSEKPESNLAAGTIQNYLDDYLKRNANTAIDYIHGIDVTENLGKKSGNLGLILPDVDKDGFFRTVVKEGALPRKTFSMGEAWEKRYYIEGRKIVK